MVVFGGGQPDYGGGVRGDKLEGWRLFVGLVVQANWRAMGYLQWSLAI